MEFNVERKRTMEKREAIYEGKAKILYTTDEDDKIIQFFKDDATAFNAQKRGTVASKGVVNNTISEVLFKHFCFSFVDRFQSDHPA